MRVAAVDSRSSAGSSSVHHRGRRVKSLGLGVWALGFRSRVEGLGCGKPHGVCSYPGES